MPNLSNQQLLELCLQVTGSFENGTPSYTALAGNADGMGLSAGVLQWNAGKGTLQHLVIDIAKLMGWDKARTFFKSDIHEFALLGAQDAIDFCRAHYLEDDNDHLVAPAAAQAWTNFLGQPESVQAQVDFATNTVLARAVQLASMYAPAYYDQPRTICFFFDLVTQSGSMKNKRGSVNPCTGAPDFQSALTFAAQKHGTVAQMWQGATQDDPLAQLLLHYAYYRSLLSRPEYVWDALSRRGTIACRIGIVHGKQVDLTPILD